MDRIDFRSDTVTWPTPAMHEAMAGARLGDDVYGEDPSVNELEERAAFRLGKEAGLFVASGTMGNMCAILTHAQRGEEAIVGRDSHTVVWEAGAMSSLGGVVPCPLPTDAVGCMDLAEITASVRGDDPHLARSRLILVENSYGARNGSPVPIDYFAGVREIADRHGLSIHLDGARLFNAAVALDLEPRELTRHVDSVTFCLSKGLCCPVGSVLCGSKDFIHQARRVRKTLGGGMRQAGILAAAGLVALETMIDRLAEDHARAKALAAGLSGIKGIQIDAAAVKTNMVFFTLAPGSQVTHEQLIERLRDEFGIWLAEEGPGLLRAVTHYWIGDADVEKFIQGVNQILTRC